ncbi:MAG: GNAT family N-acetyltransferase [Clostridia bacterium]|nr:GNAT family N-acetyltransferase [Clostridia bacterium]
MLHLRKIDRSNWREATFVTTDPQHKCPLDEEWVTSTAFSIVQSVYEPEWESRLIYDDEKIIGFVFYGMWAEKQAPLLCRYTIDVAHQGKGYGQQALPIIIREMQEQYRTNCIYLTLEESNSRAVHIYRKFGFVPTGEMDEDESVYVYQAGSLPSSE